MFQGVQFPMFRRLRSDRRGAILPMAAVVALIMVMLAGLAIDVSMIISAKNRLRRTMDAAGIAIATHFRDQTPTADEVKTFAVNWVESNYPDYKIGKYFDLNVNWANGVADITAKVKVDTIFMDVVGASEIDANVGVRVISETRGLEIALALDNTGSMNGTEMIWLKASVNKFINVLYDNATDPSTIKIGMVPFVAAVNIKDPVELPKWVNPVNPEDLVIMDDNIDTTTPQVSYNGEIFNPRTSHAYFYKLYANAALKTHWYDEWRGCVEARTLSYDGDELDVTDVPPDPAKPETLFVPYFWPDEPDNTVATGGNKDNGLLLKTSDSTLLTTTDTGDYRVRNNYINDLVDSSFTFSQRLESIAKYVDPTNAADAVKKESYSSSITRGPGKSCPNPILPLNSNRANMNDLLLNTDYLTNWNEGGSDIPQGLMWAWRVLSKNKPFTQGADYLDADGNFNKKNSKIIVLFVSGGNGIVYEPNPVYSDYSAYGYVVPNGRLDPAGTNDLDTKLLKVCQNARKPAGSSSREKITIYAIGFKISSSDPVNNLLEQCTGDPNRVFLAADTTALFATFESLAKELTKLRVVW